MRKVLSILLLIFLVWFGLTSLNSCDIAVEAATDALYTGNVTYLVCGFDDASQNTDALVLVNYSFVDNSISIIQIPRDTYYSYGTRKKINSIYPQLRSNGVEETAAIEALVEELSRSLGIEIDGYIGLSSLSIVSLIDSMGGINLRLPYPINVEDAGGKTLLSLSSGDNPLSGEEALLFIRSRAVYAMGDLGRVDAQKFFMSAVLNKLRGELTISDIIRVVTGLWKNSVSSHDLDGILKILIKNRGSFSNIEVNYANIPGAVVHSNDGGWYYSICRATSNSLLRDMHFSLNGVIDPDGKFINEKEDEFAKIYNSIDIIPRVYNENDLFDLDIKEK